MFRIIDEATVTTQSLWTDWTDEDLFLEYRCTGIREAFEEIVHRYEEELYYYLYRHFGNAADTEDIFQKTFLTVLKNADKFESGKRLRGWIFTIAANLAHDVHRNRKRTAGISIYGHDSDDERMVDTVAGSEPEPFENSMDREIAGKVRDAVAALPEPMRQAVYMVYFQGMSYKEVADAVGVKYFVIWTRVQDAVKKLNFMLKNVG